MNDLPQIREPYLDVFEPGSCTPVLFSRKVDDQTRLPELTCLDHEHPAELDFPSPACGLICPKVVRVCLLELEGDAFAHDAYGVDYCID